MKKHIYYSWEVFRLGMEALMLGLAWGTLWPQAPTGMYFPAVVALCSAYFTKRVLDRKLNPTTEVKL